MIRKTETHVIFQCDNCGAFFQGTVADGRAAWKADDWHKYVVNDKDLHICTDCNIDLRGLDDIQQELRKPREGSSIWRRQQLWRRLDKLCAS
jgi:predicted RNA-binding Zn-ribbon protein involved in translation (DUF1610 family)